MAERRAANLGLARPPLIFLAAILLGVALDAARPEAEFGAEYSEYESFVRRWL